MKNYKIGALAGLSRTIMKHFLKEATMTLTPKEFELLVYLAGHKGRVLTREQLLKCCVEL